MKKLIPTVLLSLGIAMSLAQNPPTPRTGSEFRAGYVREVFKMRDLQASPVRYVANLNGIQLAYTRLAPRTQWRVGFEVGRGNLIAPSLGIRGFKFSTEQDQPLWLVPTLYRGHLELEYRRWVRRTPNRTTWLGLGLHQTVQYADGLALNTWAMHTAAASLLYQTQWTITRRHSLTVDAALPVLAAVSRFPYSNVISRPNHSDVQSFFGETRWTSLNRFLNPQLGFQYRFELSHRLALQAGYRFNWLRYPDPRLIRTAAHAGSFTLVYKFQRQSRSIP